MILGSVSWANDTLKWLISFLKEDTWLERSYLKVIVARSIIADLRYHRFPWQVRRAENQLFLFLKNKRINVQVSVACTSAPDPDPPGRARDLSKRREAS